MKTQAPTALLLLTLVLATLTSCSTTDERADAAAEQLVQMTIDGLGKKHPSRATLEKEIEAHGEDPAELEKRAAYARIKSLAKRKTKLHRHGLGDKHPKVREVQREIDQLRVYRTDQHM